MSADDGHPSSGSVGGDQQLKVARMGSWDVINTAQEHFTNLGQDDGALRHSTDGLHNATREELLEALLEIHNVIDAKEKESKLAAKIGKQLLEANISLEQEVEGYEAQATITAERIAELELVLGEKQSHISELNSQCNYLGSQMKDAETTNSFLVKEVTDMEEELNVSKVEMKTLGPMERHLQKLQTQVAELESYKERLRLAVMTEEELAKQLLKKQSETERVRSEFLSVKTERDSLEQSLSKIDETVSESERVIHENNELKETLNTLKVEVDQLERLPLMSGGAMQSAVKQLFTSPLLIGRLQEDGVLSAASQLLEFIGQSGGNKNAAEDVFRRCENDLTSTRGLYLLLGLYAHRTLDDVEERLASEQRATSELRDEVFELQLQADKDQQKTKKLQESNRALLGNLEEAEARCTKQSEMLESLEKQIQAEKDALTDVLMTVQSVIPNPGREDHPQTASSFPAKNVADESPAVALQQQQQQGQQQTNNDLEKEVIELRARLKALDEQHHEREQKLACDAQASAEGQARALAAAQAELDVANAEHASAQQEMSNLQNNVTELETQLGVAKHSLETATERNVDLQSQVAKRHEQVSEMEARHSGEMTHLQSLLVEKEGKANEALSQLQSLRATFTERTAANAQLSADLDTLALEMATLQGKHSESEDALQSLRDQHAHVLHNLEVAQSETARLETELREAEAAKQTAEEAQRRAELQAKEQEVKMREAAAASLLMSRRMNEAEAKAAAALEELRRRKEELEASQTQAKMLQTTKLTLEKEVLRLQSEIEKLKEQLLVVMPQSQPQPQHEVDQQVPEPPAQQTQREDSQQRRSNLASPSPGTTARSPASKRAGSGSAITRMNRNHFQRVVSTPAINLNLKNFAKPAPPSSPRAKASPRPSARLAPLPTHPKAKSALAAHINAVVKLCPQGEGRQVDGNSLHLSMADGVLFCDLLNQASPGTIDERVVNRSPQDHAHVLENFNLVLNSVAAVGGKVASILPSDLLEGRVEETDRLLWELAKVDVLSRVTPKLHPEIMTLRDDGEDVSSFKRTCQQPQRILDRWVNHQAKKAGIDVTGLQDSSFDADCARAVVAQVLGVVNDDGSLPSSDELLVELETKVPEARAWMEAADFEARDDIAKTAFFATLFHHNTNLVVPSTTTAMSATQHNPDYAMDFEGDREERIYRMWLNSLPVSPYVNDLSIDLRDGLVLLQMLDKISPSLVNWTRVNLSATNAFKKLENCNYAVSLGHELGFSLVSIGGQDFVDGKLKLLLSLVWQSKFFQIQKLLKGLDTTGARQIDTRAILKWANSMVPEAMRIKSFKDPSLRSGLFFVELLAKTNPSSIDRAHVAEGVNASECEANAKLVLSVTRKLGCAIFLSFEDLLTLNSKMIMILAATIMTIYR
eukprot:TRINITY_DN4863_c0_g1_i1.p1 TRINITY_DN4863_c0_g1~~TRINITY_DN4863_c0_g1_i1.p1  ORF type:complete len:1398 (-),score=339.50 TRINITY_DN4863_c0_g1_i1:18-4211(-)